MKFAPLAPRPKPVDSNRGRRRARPSFARTAEVLTPPGGDSWELAANDIVDSTLLMAKLKVGDVNDPLERQADAIADRVVQMPTRARGAAHGLVSGFAGTEPHVEDSEGEELGETPTVSALLGGLGSSADISSVARRKCASCQAEEEGEQIRREPVTERHAYLFGRPWADTRTDRWSPTSHDVKLRPPRKAWSDVVRHVGTHKTTRISVDGAAPIDAEEVVDGVADECGDLRLSALGGGASDPRAGGADALMRACSSCEADEELMRACSSCEADEELMRACSSCEAEEELNRSSRIGARGGVTSDLYARRVMQATRTGGRTLDDSARALLEARLNVDLESVRVHVGSESTALARAIGARAFTLGQHVFFGQGEYRPSSHEGLRLIAHEVVHTLQNRGVASRMQTVARALRDSCDGLSGPPSAPEWIADETLDAVRQSTYSDEPIVLGSGAPLETVELIQQFLYSYVCFDYPSLLHDVGELESDAPGVYGATTKALVEAFQRNEKSAPSKRRLQRDGKLGPETLAAMDAFLGVEPIVGPEEDKYNLPKDACARPDKEGGAGEWVGDDPLFEPDERDLQWKIYGFGVGEHALLKEHVSFLSDHKHRLQIGGAFQHKTIVQILAERLKASDDLKLRIEGTTSRTGERKKGLNERLSRRRAYCTMLFLRRALAEEGYHLTADDVIGDGAKRAQDASVRDSKPYDEENDEFRAVYISVVRREPDVGPPPLPEPEECDDEVRHARSTTAAYITVDCDRNKPGVFYMNVVLHPDDYQGFLINRTYRLTHPDLVACSFRPTPDHDLPTPVTLWQGAVHDFGLRTADEVHDQELLPWDQYPYFPEDLTHRFNKKLGGDKYGHTISSDSFAEELLLPGVWRESCSDNAAGERKLIVEPVTSIDCGVAPKPHVAECSECMPMDKEAATNTVEIKMACHDDYHQYLYIGAPDVGVSGIYRRYMVEYFNEDDPFYQCRPIPSPDLAPYEFKHRSKKPIYIGRIGEEARIVAARSSRVHLNKDQTFRLDVEDGGFSGLEDVKFQGRVVDCDKFWNPVRFTGKIRALGPVECGPMPTPKSGDCEHEYEYCSDEMKQRGATRFRARIHRVTGDVNVLKKAARRIGRGKWGSRLISKLPSVSGTLAWVTIGTASKQAGGDDERPPGDQISRAFAFVSNAKPKDQFLRPVCGTAIAYSRVVTTKYERYLQWGHPLDLPGSDFQNLTGADVKLDMKMGRNSDSLTIPVGKVPPRTKFPAGNRIQENVTFKFYRNDIQAICGEQTAKGIMLPLGAAKCHSFPPPEFDDYDCDLGTKTAKNQEFRLEAAPAAVPSVLRGGKKGDGGCSSLFAMRVNIGTDGDDDEKLIHRNFLLIGRSLTCNFAPRPVSTTFKTKGALQIADDPFTPTAGSDFISRPVLLAPFGMFVGKEKVTELADLILSGKAQWSNFALNAKVWGLFGRNLEGADCLTFATGIGVMFPDPLHGFVRCGPVEPPPVERIEPPSRVCNKRWVPGIQDKIDLVKSGDESVQPYLSWIGPGGYVFHEWDDLVAEGRSVGPGGVVKDVFAIGRAKNGEKIVGVVNMRILRLPAGTGFGSVVWVQLTEDMCWYDLSGRPTQRDPEDCYEPQLTAGTTWSITKFYFPKTKESGEGREREDEVGSSPPNSDE